MTGARESNACDDCHNLWTCQQPLLLLLPDSALTLVKVEELAREDHAAVGDPQEDRFLAADLTENYGGCSFATATRVVVSQRKQFNPRCEDTPYRRGALRRAGLCVAVTTPRSRAGGGSR
jgi:hypothetical protein